MTINTTRLNSLQKKIEQLNLSCVQPIIILDIAAYKEVEEQISELNNDSKGVATFSFADGTCVKVDKKTVFIIDDIEDS